MFIGERKVQEAQAPRLLADRYDVPVGFLRLTERFWCIEGEGLTTGVPCYLVRFSGCNLRCRWCDSKFASWHDADAELVSAVALLEEALAWPHAWVSYTGGEPLWRRDPKLHTLASLILSLDRVRSQKVETSGTVDPPDWFPSDKLFWSIAPKTAGMGTGTYLDADLLQHILTTHAAPDRAHIKFVVGAREADGTLAEDFAVLEKLVDAVPALQDYPVIYQPEGLTESTAEYIRRCVLLIEALKANRAWQSLFPTWRVMPQTHAMLFRQERGR